MQEPPSPLQLRSLEQPLRAWLVAVWAESPFSAGPVLVKPSLLYSYITAAGSARASQQNLGGSRCVGKIVLFFPRGGDSDSYEIISTFPQRVYADNSRSLQECGLIPSASLLLQRRDPSQKEGTELQPA